MGTNPAKKAFSHLKDILIGNNIYQMDLMNSYKGADATSFSAMLAQVANDINIDPEGLLFVMYKESGLNPAAINSGSGATGLIQFMPSTAQALGTSTGALAAMTGTDQLIYVQKYLENVQATYGKDSMPDVASIYLAIFYPRALAEGLDYVLGSEISDAYAAEVAKENPGFDIGSKGYITKGDMYTYIAKNALNIS
jgi:hypothetical protein